VHITLKVEHFSFHAFYKKCGLQRDLMSCSRWLTLQRRYFSCTFPFFERATNLFIATGHNACSLTPTKISIDILLPAPKTFGLKIIVAYFTNWFQSICTVGGWRMYPFNLSLLALACTPTQSCKRASFWSLNPVRARSYKLEPG